MTVHCLNREEYKQIVNLLCRDIQIKEEYEYLNEILYSCRCWELKMVGLNTILTIILEQFMKQGVPCQDIIQRIYQFEEEMNFQIQEIDVGYLDNLFRNHISDANPLEESLIKAQSSIYE